MTRYGVPVTSPEGLSSKVNDHFAMSEYFAVIDVEGDGIVSADVVHNAPAEEGQKSAAEFLAGIGVEVVLAGRIGTCMIRILYDRNVKMFSGAEGTVKDALEHYLSGKLSEVHMGKYTL